MMMAEIRPINKADVHRICSGQVILDLASAVKELVENSLDAGANSIEVRLKEYGGELFEVGDNGFGISPHNYQSATLKYHTSKISDFYDLQSLSLFGFRGEALSSLCALGNVTIETRTQNESIGTQLICDNSGLIISQNSLARQIGTTVRVANLFSPLPVRYKEFHRNIRREYSRLLSLLQAYALIAKGVRLVCSNVVGRNPKVVVLRTQGSGSVKDNIITVFGTKTLACLVDLNFCISDGCRIEGFVSKPGFGSGRASGDRQFFYVNGRPVDMPKVTKLLNEIYKSYNSQQYPMAVLNFILPTTTYDVNVTPDKRKIFIHDEGPLMSAVRESLDKIYAPSKYTYSINNVEMSSQVRDTFLSSVSPCNLEKQEPSFTDNSDVIENGNSKLLVLEESRSNSHTEDLFQEPKKDVTEEENPENQNVDGALTESVSDTREPETSTPLIDLTAFKCGSASELTKLNQSLRVVDKSSVSSMEKAGKRGLEDLGLVSDSRPVQSKITHFVTPIKRQHEEGSLLSEEPVLKKWMFCAEKNSKCINKEIIKRPRMGFCLERGDCSMLNLTSKNEDENGCPEIQDFSEKISTVQCCNEQAEDQRESPEVEGDHDTDEANTECENPKMMSQDDDMGMKSDSMQIWDVGRVSRTDEVVGTALMSEVQLDDKDNADGQVDTKVSSELMSEAQLDDKDNVDEQIDTKVIRIVQFNINRCRLKSSMGLLKNNKNVNLQEKQKRHKKRCYAAATLEKGSVVVDGEEKEVALAAATRELERSFNKEDFRKMKVIGQFNLGFIIGKIDDDLFIIDQHASDEKYNFEHLSRTTILNRQPLLRPLALELTAVEEVTISTHMDIFRRNGFDFVEDTSAPAGRRFLLTAVPYSRNITFGVGDVQELISILVDEPAPSIAEYNGSVKCSYPSDNSCEKAISRSVSAVCPSRVRAMLASRACRKSVMIGDALSKKDMEMILQHLSTLDSPWNCPHGRPTMRHLFDLSTLNQI